MKILLIILFATGLGLFATYTVLWAIHGFPFNFHDMWLSLTGDKPWHLKKDSYFFFMVLGVFLALYSLIELQHRRWEKNKE